MTQWLAGRPPPGGRPPARRPPEVTVREDLATGIDALHVVTTGPGDDPPGLAQRVAADYLDGAGMVVVEAPLAGPAPAGPGPADDGCDLLWVYRDLAERPPRPGPAVPAESIGPDPALADGLVLELAASLALGARYCGLADLLPEQRVLQARARTLLPGAIRWAGLRRDDGVAYVLWQRLTDPFLRTEVVDLVDICGAARGVTELLVAHVAVTERARRVRGNVAVSPAEPTGWQVLRGLRDRGWTVGGGRWRFAVAGAGVLPWRAAPAPWRRAALAAAGRAAG
ncbi:MAG: hypothetical protein ACJ73E_08420 [Mycobacteriales bacterium]